MRSALLLLPLAVVACSTTKSAVVAEAPSNAHGALTFIEDDYGQAVAEGKRSGRPIFVEIWAPW